MTYDEYEEKEYYVRSVWYKFSNSYGVKYLFGNNPIKKEMMETINLYKPSIFYMTMFE